MVQNARMTSRKMLYSLYDGAWDKTKIKAQFETAMNDCVKRLKDS